LMCALGDHGNGEVCLLLGMEWGYWKDIHFLMRLCCDGS
jgi:hypothetical protein